MGSAQSFPLRYTPSQPLDFITAFPGRTPVLARTWAWSARYRAPRPSSASAPSADVCADPSPCSTPSHSGDTSSRPGGPSGGSAASRGAGTPWSRRCTCTDIHLQTGQVVSRSRGSPTVKHRTETGQETLTAYLLRKTTWAGRSVREGDAIESSSVTEERLLKILLSTQWKENSTTIIKVGKLLFFCASSARCLSCSLPLSKL